MTKFYQEPGMSTQAKIQLFYPDMRLKTAELLDFFIYSTVLDFYRVEAVLQIQNTIDRRLQDPFQ